MKYALCALLFLGSACSDKGLVQYRDGHPVGTPADDIYEAYWKKQEEGGLVRRPHTEPIDREILMTKVIGCWVPDPAISKTEVPEGAHVEIRSDGTVRNPAGVEVGQWDMRRGRIDIWSKGEYKYSMVMVKGRLCHISDVEPYGFCPMVRVTPKK